MIFVAKSEDNFFIFTFQSTFFFEIETYLGYSTFFFEIETYLGYFGKKNTKKC